MCPANALIAFIENENLCAALPELAWPGQRLLTDCLPAKAAADCSLVAGDNYLIGVDGVNGAFGTVVLNYNLNVTAPSGAPQISDLGTTNGLLKFRINSITNRFVVQVSTNLASWVPLTTNNAPVYLYDYVDWRSTNFPLRYYRVQVVP